MSQSSLSKTRRVMVLEDEIMVSSLLELILTEEGYEVGGPFRTNRIAIDWLDGERPDVALIDFNIAEGTSAATAGRLRALNIPFVVVSGYPKSIARNDDLATAEWLDKPFSEEALLHALDRALERAGQTAA